MDSFLHLSLVIFLSCDLSVFLSVSCLFDLTVTGPHGGSSGETNRWVGFHENSKKATYPWGVVQGGVESMKNLLQKVTYGCFQI